MLTGLSENPLTLKWMTERSTSSSTNKIISGPSLVSDRDYESVVLTKLRQAAERKRLIEEMLKEEQQ